MRYLPNALAVLSLPAGAVGYIVAAQVVAAIAPADGADILTLFIPLFVAGLVMLPFLIPYFDRKAKQDLEVIRRRREAEATNATGDAAAGGTPRVADPQAPVVDSAAGDDGASP